MMARTRRSGQRTAPNQGCQSSISIPVYLNSTSMTPLPINSFSLLPLPKKRRSGMPRKSVLLLWLPFLFCKIELSSHRNSLFQNLNNHIIVVIDDPLDERQKRGVKGKTIYQHLCCMCLCSQSTLTHKILLNRRHN